MNLLAKSLNEVLEKNNPHILEMLSNTGKELFMPKGILSQSAEARTKATKYNATIGISTAKGEPMYLESMFSKFHGMHPKNLFTYAPPAGLPELRELWSKKIKTENPLLNDTQISNPVVCNAITNGLAVAGHLFLDKGDFVVLPDKFWGNYRLMFNTLIGAEIATYPTFNENKGYNVEGLLQKVKECGITKKKVFVVLNFPNNPTGYTLTKDEAVRLSDGLVEIAENGMNIVTVSDDAYFGLFFDDVYKSSLFSMLAGRSERLMAIKVDGITKESFAWGFRVGFITFGQTVKGDNSEIFNVLETKAAGYLRGTISSAPHPSQSITVDVLKEPSFKDEVGKLNAVIEERCKKVKSIFDKGLYADEFTAYPFNSGYFMCIRLNNIDAETLRKALLDKYGVGVISTNQTDIRIAFSSVDVEDIEGLYSCIYQCCKSCKA